MKADESIRFEPEEACPPSIALVVGAQGAMLVLAPMVLNVAIAIRSSGLGDSYLTWGVFAAMLICAGITGLQALQLRRFGAGHIVLAWPAAMFIAIMVATISAAGVETFVSLMVVCSLVSDCACMVVADVATDRDAGCFGNGDDADRGERVADRVRQHRGLARGQPGCRWSGDRGRNVGCFSDRGPERGVGVGGWLRRLSASWQDARSRLHLV